MAFDPLNPATWQDDPDDFIVPKHELGTLLDVAEADAEEQAQARAFGGPDFEDGVQREALRQMDSGREALWRAYQALKDAEEALGMTDDEITEELHRRAGDDWERLARGEDI